MGVPALFSTLIRNYNKPKDGSVIIRKNIKTSEVQSKTNYLVHFHLDFNSVLYLCLRPDDHIEIKDEDVLIIHILAYLDKLVKMLIDTNGEETQIGLLHICLDGVSVEFKQVQMRNRRMHSVIARYRTNEINARYGDSSKENLHNSEFDTNRFSPGTVFMHKLSAALRDHLSSEKIYSSVGEIILSDTLVPGEGEIKILQYIKTHPVGDEVQTVIYALDADVIIQSLISGQKQIYLLRESGMFGHLGDFYDGTSFLYLDVDCLKKALLTELITSCPLVKISPNKQQFINDLCMLFFMLGNDFIPKIHHISIHHNGIAYLTSAYVASYTKLRSHLVDATNLLVNTAMYCEILAILASREESYIKKFWAKRQCERIPIKDDMSERQRQQMLVNFLPLQYLEAEKDINPLSPKWEDRYYRKAFGFPASDTNIANVVDFYLKSIVWNFRYYFGVDCPSWMFYYPYSYPPTLRQIFNHLASKVSDINTRYRFEIGTPIAPQCLLVKVLSSHSKDFMIASIRDKLVLEPELKPYFPEKYGINLLFNRYYHECTPQIPHLNRQLVEKIVSRCELTADENERNKIGDIWIRKSYI